MASKEARGRVISRLFYVRCTLKKWKTNMSNQPAQKYRLGLITTTIWENNGFYSVDVARSYKDDAGEWKNTSSFHHSDLLNVAKCIERAETWIGKQVNDR